MSVKEFGQMPNCNFVKSIHNKWFQASDNKGGHLYVETVDDYIRAFLQVVSYHQFLKGGIGGDGSSKKNLKLRCAQCNGDPVVLQKVFLDMPDKDEFCTRSPHLEGAKVFGLQNASPTPPMSPKDVLIRVTKRMMQLVFEIDIHMDLGKKPKLGFR